MKYELEIETSLHGDGVKTVVMDESEARVLAILHSQSATGDGYKLSLWDGIELKASIFLD